MVSFHAGGGGKQLKKSDMQALLAPARRTALFGSKQHNHNHKADRSDYNDDDMSDINIVQNATSAVNIVGLIRTPTKPGGGNGNGGGTPATPPVSPSESSHTSDSDEAHGHGASPPIQHHLLGTTSPRTLSPQDSNNISSEDTEDEMSDLTAPPSITGAGGDPLNNINSNSKLLHRHADPPGRMVHTRSNDGSSDSGVQSNLATGGGTAASLLVNNLLCMMDYTACAAPMNTTTTPAATAPAVPPSLAAAAAAAAAAAEATTSAVRILDVVQPFPSTTQQPPPKLTSLSTTRSLVDMIEGAITPTPYVLPAPEKKKPVSEAASPRANNSSSNSIMSNGSRAEQHENFEMILQEQNLPNKKSLLQRFPFAKSFRNNNNKNKERRSHRSLSPTPRLPSPVNNKGRSHSSDNFHRYQLSKRPSRRQEEEKKEEAPVVAETGFAYSTTKAATKAAAPARGSYSRFKPMTGKDINNDNDNQNADPIMGAYLPPPPLPLPAWARQQQQPTTTVFATTKAQKEARYKHLLGALMSMNHRTPLETVREELSDCGDSWCTANTKGNNNESTELKVRVPGLVHPDAFISDKDLLGEECSQSHYEEDEDYCGADAADVKANATRVNQGARAIKAFEWSEEEKVTSSNSNSILRVASPVLALLPFKKKPHPDVEHVSENPSGSFPRSQTWIEKLGLHHNNKASAAAAAAEEEDLLQVGTGGISNKIDAVLMNRQRSAPHIKLFHQEAEKVQAPPTALNGGGGGGGGTAPKLAWKAATCPKTGRTYYYHRSTRKTTWVKPSDEELFAPMNPTTTTAAVTAMAAAAAATTMEDAKTSDDVNITKNDNNEKNGRSLSPIPESENDALLRKRSHRDFDRRIWKIKQEIVGILMAMSPPNARQSVDRIMAQYEGREEELLIHLKDLAESTPFDEQEPFDEKPFSKKKAEGGTVTAAGTTSTTTAAAAAVPDAATTGGATINTSAFTADSSFAGSSNLLLKSRVRTHTSRTSFVSGNTSAKFSASTQQIKNTGKGKHNHSSRSNVIHEEESHATSISSKMGYLLPPGEPLCTVNEGSSPARVPSNIPVPRSRDLVVEDFSSERVQGENFARKPGVIRSKNANKTPPTPNNEIENISPIKAMAPDASEYYGDGEETDTKDTDTISIHNDSISALSEADLSFTGRKEAYDKARRQALDEAIAREDWDLAAALSEGMRTIKATDARTGGGRGEKNHEWAQTELDKFISENDWDAVANYISHVREKAKNGKGKGKSLSPRKKGPKGPRPAGGGYRPEKRFGAKSQLQHGKLNYDDDSWDSKSESSYESGYSSVSSYTDEEPFRQRRRKNFAC